MSPTAAVQVAATTDSNRCIADAQNITLNDCTESNAVVYSRMSSPKESPCFG